MYKFDSAVAYQPAGYRSFGRPGQYSHPDPGGSSNRKASPVGPPAPAAAPAAVYFGICEGVPVEGEAAAPGLLACNPAQPHICRGFQLAAKSAFPVVTSAAKCWSHFLIRNFEFTFTCTVRRGTCWELPYIIYVATLIHRLLIELESGE